MSEYERQRRILVSQAGSAFLDAMIAFTAEHGELTFAEWLKAWNDALLQRMLNHELSHEWSERR